MTSLTSSRPPYDAKAMVQSLIEPFTTHAEWFERMRLNMACPDDFYLRDLRTVGLRLPRQNLASRTAAELFAQRDDALFVTYNLPMKAHLIANFDGGTFAGGENVDHKRITTPWEIKRSMAALHKGEPDPLPPAKFIIIDDANHFFYSVKATRFYEWLAKRGGHDQVILTIN